MVGGVIPVNGYEFKNRTGRYSA